MDDFLPTLALLRAKYYRPPTFNLFSILRSDTDEVRLHSRFLVYLLNPQASHDKGTQLLQVFLRTLGVDDFSLEGVSVVAEYRNIDILIRNTAGQAILIENKIHAPDQPEQLARYHALMKNEVATPRCFYLTLDGSEPSEQSRQEVHVELLSYETDIIDWLNGCIALVAQAPGLREGIFQYIELLQKLTSSNQGEHYMQKLKQQLLQGDNLLLVKDIQHAYKEVLIDLQLDLWQRMLAYQAQQYPQMGEPTYQVERIQVRDYYTKSRNNRYYGMGYAFKSHQGGVGIEIGESLFYGVYCYQVDFPEEHAELKRLISLKPQEQASAHWPLWKYATPRINLINPETDDLALLRDNEVRENLARSIIDDLFGIWTTTLNALRG